MNTVTDGGGGSRGIGGDGSPQDDGFLGPDDEFHYRSDKTGATVYSQPGWDRNDRGKERLIARHLADNGYCVVLRAPIPGEPSPDAWLDANGRRMEAEFKLVSHRANNVDGSIRSAIRDAWRQARCAVVYIDRPDVTLEEAWYSIARQLRLDVERRIDEIVLVMYDGVVAPRTRQEILR